MTLTAANPQLTTPQAPGFPAVVNHVVYFGDGISSNTVLRGFRIAGANHFVTEKLTKQMEPDTYLKNTANCPLVDEQALNEVSWQVSIWLG